MMRRLLREDDGFSLMELMVAMAIGSIVLTATMFLFTTGLTGANRVSDRVDASQRGRVAMDRITSLLNSQVCLLNTDQTTTPPITSGDANSMTFYADLDGASDTPDKYALSYNATAKTLTLARYAGSGTMGSTVTPLTFATTPTTTQLADQVQQATDQSTGNAIPIFSYYSFDANGNVNEAAPIATVTSGATGNAGKVVRVGVMFQVNPARTKVNDARRDVISGEGVLSSADPTDQSSC